MGLSEIGKMIADPFGLELVRLTRSNHAMDFELTPEQQTLQSAAIEFARRELNSNMIERDAQQVFSRDSWQKCAASECRECLSPRSTVVAVQTQLLLSR